MCSVTVHSSGLADFDPTCNTNVDMLPWQSDIVLTPSVYTVAPPDPLNLTPTLVPLPLAAHEACVNCTSGHVIPRRQRATIRRSQLEGGVIKGSLSTPLSLSPSPPPPTLRSAPRRKPSSHPPQGAFSRMRTIGGWLLASRAVVSSPFTCRPVT